LRTLFCPHCGSSKLNAHKKNTDDTVVFLGSVNNDLVGKLPDESESNYILCLGCARRYKLEELINSKPNTQRNKVNDIVRKSIHYTCQNCNELNKAEINESKHKCIKCGHINILMESKGKYGFNMRLFSIIGVALLMFLFFYSRMSISSTVIQDQNVISEFPEAAKDDSIQAAVPEYKVLHTNTTYCNYEVLIGEINLNGIDYKSDIKRILDEIAKMHGSTKFHAYFYDNQKAADLNYSDLELGQRLSNKENEFVNYHLVATYGDFGDDRYFISFFENIPSVNRNKYKAWREAYNESDFKEGYTPKL
jgi:hypothetical protein